MTPEVLKVTAENTETTCPAGECDGHGALWVDECTCGVGPHGYYGMHERYCGSEPCPAGCEFRPSSYETGGAR